MLLPSSSSSLNHILLYMTKVSVRLPHNIIMIIKAVKKRRGETQGLWLQPANCITLCKWSDGQELHKKASLSAVPFCLEPG
jgi:hypothetical protein